MLSNQVKAQGKAGNPASAYAKRTPRREHVEFTALRLICASLPNRVGFDERNLPVREHLSVLLSTLETLHLHVNEGRSFSGAIDQLAELSASKSFPQLAAIHIKYPQLRKLDNVVRFEWLQERCQDGGVFCLPYNNAGEWVQGEREPYDASYLAL